MLDANTLLSGSYDPDDVVFLLKLVQVQTTGVAEKERRIQTGEAHYSEMISEERRPDARYMDYYERALYNQILGSQDPRTGGVTYFYSLKPGHFKT